MKTEFECCVCVCVGMVTTCCDGWEGEMFLYFLCVCVFTGEITTTALLDRELKSEYILIVRAVDGGVGPLQKTGIATVTAHCHSHSFLFHIGGVFWAFSPGSSHRL